MTSVAARVTAQTQFGYVPHTSTSGDAWQLVRKGTATSAGAADGTTIIDANLGGSDNDFNGRWWIRQTSGANQGEMCRIVDYTASTGACTLENKGFPAQCASGVEYELWLSPEPVVLVDSSSGETNMVDAVRAESNDTWNGYWACPITGTHRGKKAEITDFVSSTGTFTLGASFGSALAAGDVVLIRKFIETGDFSPSLEEGYHPRPQNRVNFARGDGTVGARAGTCSFSAPITPNGTLSASGSVAGKSVLSGLFEPAGLEEQQDTSSTVGAGSTTTAIKIATGSWENHSIGGAVCHNGNWRWVTGLTDGGGAVDTVTVSPALPVAPTSADVLYAGCTYRKSTDGDTYGVCIEYENDGIRHTLTGCKGSVTLADGQEGMLAFEFSVDHWIRNDEAAPYNAGTAYTGTATVMTHDRQAWLDTTATNIKGFTATPGTAVVPKDVQGSCGINGRSGFQISDYACTATWREVIDNTTAAADRDQELRWTARTAKAVQVVYGGGSIAFGCRLPVARTIEAPHPDGGAGILEAQNMVEAQDAGVTDDGGGTSQKVPDFAFFIS